MTKRETGIVAFAAFALVLAVVVALGHPSLRPTPAAHLPALNGPPPAATPGSEAVPSTAPSPMALTPRMPPATNVAMGRLEPGEDEAEDEPASAEGAPPRWTGSSSASSPGSGGQSLLPGLKLPGGTSPLPGLCCLPAGPLALPHR